MCAVCVRECGLSAYNYTYIMNSWHYLGNQGYILDIERRPHPPDNFGPPQGTGGAFRGADSTIFPLVFQQHGIPLGAFLPPPGKVQVPLPPPPPPKPVGWECPMCTYINKPQRPGCEQCATPRPEDYKVPNDAPFDGPGRNEEILLVQVMQMGVIGVGVYIVSTDGQLKIGVGVFIEL